MHTALASLAIVALTCSPLLAQAPPPTSQQHRDLSFFAGKWTLKGSEATYLETCEWLDTYLVCRGDERTESGVSSSLSIMGYSAEEQAFTHTSGFGGTPRTLRGWLRNGTWVFTGNRVTEDRFRRLQVTIASTPDGFHFRQDISDNGGAWEPQYDFTYVRVP